MNTYRFLPFGEALSSSEQIPNAFEFVGPFGVAREGHGLDYMHNRWYSPSQGRFTQIDPIELSGGTNFYAYANNDPLGAVDPTGHSPYPVGTTWEAFEAAQAWWKVYDAARIAASGKCL